MASITSRITQGMGPHPLPSLVVEEILEALGRLASPIRFAAKAGAPVQFETSASIAVS
jgi:hypothetical protein